MPSQPTCPPAELDTWVADQRGAIEELEAALWDGGLNEALLAPYQAAFRELEQRVAARGADKRYGFVIVIPVADSPLHLKDCLNSLLQLCELYGYGGRENGRWRKVSVLLADDSGEPAAIEQNRKIAVEFDRQGLTTHYFGLEEQLALMDTLAGQPPTSIVGGHRRDAFHHKGQGMMRNIAYLKLAEMFPGNAAERLLFYTIDADQEFKVKVATPEGGREVFAVNFLYRLDEIFTRTDARILTGKVVGDPPVSPAVMAGNFLEDVIGFLREMGAVEPGAAYCQPGARSGGDAAYHDMADLFGFKQSGDAYRYRCPLPGEPDNAACFASFSQRLNRFFHGEHPTRITWFQYEAALASARPARTIYTGNYVFRPEALSWFIPFAPLRLRMSGPTMGRLLKAEMGDGFVSANVPMLHKRTVEATGQSEFRPGVLDESRAIDLCGEFERQFHGDVMLFSMQHLTALGYPGEALTASEIGETLVAMQGEMREKYRIKQQSILERLTLLNERLHDAAQWWRSRDNSALMNPAHPLRVNCAPELSGAVANFERFADNLARNFGADSPCYARIDDVERRADWRARQAAAITGFQDDRRGWNAALDLLARGRVL